MDNVCMLNVFSPGGESYSKHLVFLHLPVLSNLPGWLQVPGCYDGIPTDAISAKLSSTLWVREHSPILV